MNECHEDHSHASGSKPSEYEMQHAQEDFENLQKIFEDGTIGRRIKTSHLREFLTTFGDDPLTEEEAQELIQDMDQVNFFENNCLIYLHLKLLQGEVQSDAVAMELVHGMPLDDF